jgi:hypothetical protein
VLHALPVELDPRRSLAGNGVSVVLTSLPSMHELSLQGEAVSKDDLIGSVSERDRNAFLVHVHADIFSVGRFRRRVVVTTGGGRRIGNPKEFLFGVRLVYSELRPAWIGYDVWADGNALRWIYDRREGGHLIVNCDAELKKRVWRQAWRFFHVHFLRYQWTSEDNSELIALAW